MSEPSSLYAKIKIASDDKEAFLNSKITPASAYRDWVSWLAKKKFHGTIAQRDIDGLAYPDTSIREYLSLWLSGHFPGNGFSEYDEATGIWTVSMIEFSENFFDYIKFLNVLRGVGQYAKTDCEGFILIHNYLWGDTGDDSVMEIDNQTSQFLSQIPETYLQEAQEHLANRVKALQQD